MCSATEPYAEMAIAELSMSEYHRTLLPVPTAGCSVALSAARIPDFVLMSSERRPYTSEVAAIFILASTACWTSCSKLEITSAMRPSSIFAAYTAGNTNKQKETKIELGENWCCFFVARPDNTGCSTQRTSCVSGV